MSKKGLDKKDLDEAKATPDGGEKDRVEISGVVIDVFGRRFTLEAQTARDLVDLGKFGAGLVIVEPGATLNVVGRRKRGEIKAARVTREGGASFALRKDKPPKAKPVKAAMDEVENAGVAAPAPEAATKPLTTKERPKAAATVKPSKPAKPVRSEKTDSPEASERKAP
jgi:hypothetical protein